MRRLIRFLFTIAVVLVSVGLATAAYRDGRLLAGHGTPMPSAGVTS